jgi:hypothetical protein
VNATAACGVHYWARQLLALGLNFIAGLFFNLADLIFE